MPTPRPAHDLIANAFEAACLAELQAIKPGNVHVFADGHNMVVEDFVKSAHAAADVIAQPGLSVGQRIFKAIDATWNAVGCNTNLGIILLAAPLVQSALSGQGLHQILVDLTCEDADDAFRAIVRASPAGLGSSSRYDVHEAPQVTLFAAMCEAAPRDRIAFQYAHDYVDIFEFGLPRYREALARWGNETWAATSVHLGFMARFPDAHMVRKYGAETAAALSAEVQYYEQAFQQCENPKLCLGDLLRFDMSLKQRGFNPGTSADLTVGTLLAASLEKYLYSSSK